MQTLPKPHPLMKQCQCLIGDDDPQALTNLEQDSLFEGGIIEGTTMPGATKHVSDQHRQYSESYSLPVAIRNRPQALLRVVFDKKSKHPTTL